MAYAADVACALFPVPVHCLLQIPMRLPFALAALDWIASRDVQGARLALDLDGQRGWTCRVDGGYCVATALTLPPHDPMQVHPHAHPHAQPLAAALDDDPALARWLLRLSLVLAGQPALRDDSLCLANDVLWWVHRFDAGEPAARVEAQLRRQLLACMMVTSQGTRADAVPPASFTPHASGRPAGAADASRRLHTLRRC
ncbi:MAG: hypothetical protein BGP02_00315 [Pandoraea sp. 64-18]|nr:MAG: hypothetical protein BGP02_00315 [Pandoraea sp. 64-18]